MTYKTVALLLSESAAVDARGNASLIALLPPRIGATLPAQFVPTLCAIFEQDEPAPVAAGVQLEVSVQAVDPAGSIAFLARQAAPIGEKTDDEPHRISLLMQIPLNVTRPGRFVVTTTIDVPSADGTAERIEASASVFIGENTEEIRVQ